MSDVIFLTMDDVLAVHSDQLARYGGHDGFIDRGVVESAIAQPQASMFGQYLHPDVAAMAGAYLFHLAASQGFMDGNKRTGAACCVVFLAMNGYQLNASEIEVYNLTMSVANYGINKDGVADWIRQRLAPLI